ncbi:thiol reductant ABC exporter subunit CydC [Actinoallomurus soli]|uniref:thiol reductant ABC exporter subunit CydC n=1 Tax=Actinoallomurus soli TaxID=2952535 RepID=UPI0020929C9C|nr:thiol reductant ABC exporter subunit CydC [Actinoallomurus soli]MCO5973430.1 thiol reductant ABC exporter subunit CydC [Actinoallomurus soli]
MRRRVEGWEGLRLAGAVAAGTSAEFCAVALTATAAWLIARAGQHPPLSALALAIVGVRAFALFRGVLRYGERLVGHDAALRVLAGLRVRVYEALRRAADPAEETSPRTPRDADAVQRMVADVESVQDLLLRCLLPASVAWLTGLAAIAVTAVLLPAAGAVLAVGVVLAGGGLPALAALAARADARRAADARADLAVHALDLERGAADLAAFGATRRFTARAEAAAGRLARLERRAGVIEAAVAALGTAVQGATVLAVLWTARRSGADGVLVTVLTLTALASVDAVLPVAEAARRLSEIRPAALRVLDLLRAGGRPRPRRVFVPAPVLRPALDLRGVRVSYVRDGGGSVPALDGVDLCVPAGRKLAVVGASGAGKSTLLGVLTGEVRPAEGVVLLGDAPLGAYEPRDVRATVRGLAQDAHVFNASIRANVTLARPDATDVEAADAARRAGLLGWIETLPEGWDTLAGDARSSGGQRQRLLFARALLADPPVLVLDEPTEGLDLATADRLITDLLTDRRTVVLVTHRLAPLAAADEIVVLDRGRIVQRGTHRALTEVPGPYQDLWAAESRPGTVPAIPRE